MVKRIKNNKKLFLIAILVFVGGSITGVAAYNVYANQVSYDNTTSGLISTKVDDAIDELYDKANNIWCKKGYTKGSDTAAGYTCEVNE